MREGMGGSRGHLGDVTARVHDEERSEGLHEGERSEGQNPKC
jgi:hypothetical protein